MMKDWECMTDLLLEEPGRGEERKSVVYVGLVWSGLVMLLGCGERLRLHDWRNCWDVKCVTVGSGLV